MKRFGIRFFLMQKRMLKKASYLVIMLSLPLLVAAMKNLSSENKEMLTIVMGYSENADSMVHETVNKMVEKEGVLAFVSCSVEEAERKVREGEADVAWIFPDDLADRIRRVAEQGELKPVVSTVWREKIVSLELTKEILSSALYPTLAYEAYRSYVIHDLDMEGELSEEELTEYFNQALITNNLFEMGYLDGEMEEEDVGFLMAPVRGIMALWLVLCGLAADMYFLADEKNGVFAYMPMSKRWLMALSAQTVVMLDAAVVLLISLKLSGVFVGLGREVLCILLFVLCTLLFCTLLRILLKKVETIGFITPLLMAAMMVFCPVFLRSSGWRPIKLLLPPFYYLNAIHNDQYIFGMMIYIAVSGMVVAMLHLLRGGKFTQG